MKTPRTDAQWINPRAKFSLSVLQAEGKESEFSAGFSDAPISSPDDWDGFMLINVSLSMTEYPAEMLLERLDSIRSALAQWIELAGSTDDPLPLTIAQRLGGSNG